MGGLCFSFFALLPYLHSLQYPAHSPVFAPSGECQGECRKLKPMHYHYAPPAELFAVGGLGGIMAAGSMGGEKCWVVVGSGGRVGDWWGGR